MEEPSKPVARLSHFLQRHLLSLLLGSYALAAVLPNPGLWVREVSFSELHLFPDSTGITVPMLMLAVMLFTTGLGIDVAQLTRLLRRPQFLLAGLAANLIVPLLFLVGVAPILHLWYDLEEAQNLLVGLGLVAAMPIAGSSTAWSQNARGNLALSLGLVVFSTLLSPFTTPVVLQTIRGMTSGDHEEGLHELASADTGEFLLLFALVPSLIGMTMRAALGKDRVHQAKPALTLLNSACLLLLNYSNASVSLPQVITHPDWEYLGLLLLVVLALCGLAFAAGWWVAAALRADRAQRRSLMFGLGMNNNGTGLVLAATAFSHLPGVMLPIICYNLVQHLAAGVANALQNRLEDTAALEGWRLRIDPPQQVRPASTPAALQGDTASDRPSRAA
jgi:bile acid:Na+ symporter, BASS family